MTALAVLGALSLASSLAVTLALIAAALKEKWRERREIERLRRDLALFEKASR